MDAKKKVYKVAIGAPIEGQGLADRPEPFAWQGGRRRYPVRPYT
jgi:hypothetical protein